MADTVPDQYQVIGVPPGSTDTINAGPIGTDATPGTVNHYAIAGGQPAPTQTPP